MVSFYALSFSHKGRETSASPVPALKDITCTFGRGRIHAILGSSGCGKSTLLKLAAGLLAPDSGRVEVDGQTAEPARAGTSIIFQDFGLLPWKTVAGNASLPLLLKKTARSEREKKVGALLEELGLAPFSRFFPDELSGGMKQRLAIARALSTSPDLLLMDEPFSSLDALSREQLQDILLEVHARHGATILIVTHSIEEAAYLADTVTVISGKNPGSTGAFLELGKAFPRSRTSTDYFDSIALIRKTMESKP